MTYRVPEQLMSTIRTEVDHEVGYVRHELVPRRLDPRVVIARDIHIRGQEAYAAEGVPEFAHGKTRAEQGGAP